MLHSELRGRTGHRTKCEWKSFEKAVRNVETDAATGRRGQQKIEPASTPLLVFSLLFPSYWMIDCTLYVALLGGADCRACAEKKIDDRGTVISNIRDADAG